MKTYAFWNNKGGVGKSFLVFIASSEYAHRHSNSDVYVIDLCPQANVSESLLGGYKKGAENIKKLLRTDPRATVSGYLDARLNSPFRDIEDVSPYVTQVNQYNRKIPENLYLVCGDNLLEIQSEAIRQTSQLAVPASAWKQVISWIKDLTNSLNAMSGTRDVIVMVDCNPSFAIYTQLAMAASENLIVPFTADDSSRRGIENIIALLYGIGDEDYEAYLKISFSSKAREEGASIPKLHTFISNRVTKYKKKPSTAFQAVINTIKGSIDQIHDKHREIFSIPSERPSKGFKFIPDYHSACILSSTAGLPLHAIRPGHQSVHGSLIQLNKPNLEDYKEKLSLFVDRL